MGAISREFLRRILTMAAAMFVVAGCASDVNLDGDAAVDAASTPTLDRGSNTCSADLDPPQYCINRACGASAGIRTCVGDHWGSCECLVPPTPDASVPTDAPVAVDNPPTDTGPTCELNETFTGGRCVSNCGLMGCAAGQQCVQLITTRTWTCYGLTPDAGVTDTGPAAVCNTNDRRACPCLGGGGGGIQECNSSHTGYDLCMCPTTPDAGMSMDAGTLIDTGPAAVCNTNDRRACPCLGGGGGIQECNSSHTGYDLCMCPTTPDAGVSDVPVIDTAPAPDASVSDVFTPLTCPVGRADCDLVATNGCEASTSNNTMNCGACGNICPVRANAPAICVGGVCDMICTTGFADCDRSAADGCETDTRSSLANCGACGTTCPTRNNANAICARGTCGLSCNPGYADCDHDATNGCEIDTRVTENNCGACGRACGAGQFCVAGACQFACTPAPGGVSLNSCPGGATCIDLQTDLANCGACGNVCRANVASHTTCTRGACGNACDTGYGDCDHVVLNGCERELLSDVNHCGACGNVCPPVANATPSCNYGWCGGTCNAGFDDCDWDWTNGCEASLQTDTVNCGACGRRCGNGQSCARGVCVGAILPTCPTGQTDCSFGWSDGPICSNLASDRVNCGRCGYSCGYWQTCQSGFCSSCPGSQIACGNICRDVQTDPSNCGSCGLRCASGQSCVAGACITSCPTGQTSCGGACVSTATDLNNCGACGNACFVRANASAASCSGGACGNICLTGFADCNGAVIDGCEASLTTDANCGRCGNICGSGMTCSSGACVAVTTDAGVTDGGLFPGEHTLFMMNGSGVADTDAGVTVGSISNVCRPTMVIQTYNSLRGGVLSSPAGSALNTPITGGRANVKFFCGVTQIDLLAAYRAGARNLRDLLGSDAVLRVDGRTVDLTMSLIVRDIYAGGYAVVVDITEPDGSIKPGSMITP